MARPLRIEYEGAVYHITSRGNARQDIFLGDEDRRMLLAILAQAAARFGWFCHAYCLLPNHNHLLVETGSPTLSRGMLRMNGLSTQSHNRRHARTGHVFQERFKALLVQKETHLLEVARYIVLNPVRAGLTQGPQDWEWSSYRATARQSTSPEFLTVDWILPQFDTDPTRAARAYRAFVEHGRGGRLWDQLRCGAFLATEAFIAKLRPRLNKQADSTEILRSQRLAGRPSLAELFANAHDKAARDEQIYQAVHVHGYTLQQVANCLGLYYSTISVIAKRVAHSKQHQE